jgi:hypothetical protein
MLLLSSSWLLAKSKRCEEAASAVVSACAVKCRQVDPAPPAPAQIRNAGRLARARAPLVSSRFAVAVAAFGLFLGLLEGEGAARFPAFSSSCCWCCLLVLPCWPLLIFRLSAFARLLPLPSSSWLVVVAHSVPSICSFGPPCIPVIRSRLCLLLLNLVKFNLMGTVTESGWRAFGSCNN